MRKRAAVAMVACIAMAGLDGRAAGAAEKGGKRPAVASVKLLSEHGSTRAARYAVTNKIVTIGGKTHVAWLDSISRTMVATYDHASGTWSGPVKVGDGKDNHGGPALTCDSKGVLHVIFGPHVGPFQHCRSARPNDATTWVKLSDFGDGATYPSVVCDDADTLHIIYRGGPDPRKLLYQSLTKGGAWSTPRPLARASIKSGYTHYHSSLTIAPDQSLHVCYDIYAQGKATCAGHMMSRDRGKTWTLADGSPLDLPVSPESAAFFKRSEDRVRTTGIVCDAKSRPWISLAGPEVWHHDGKTWRSFQPGKRISPAIDVEKLSSAWPLTLDTNGRVYVAAVYSGSVVVLCSDDRGKTFRLMPILEPDAKLPHTGLNIERPTGHHCVAVPWLLFSTGLKGPDCYGKGIYHKVRVARLAW